MTRSVAVHERAERSGGISYAAYELHRYGHRRTSAITGGTATDQLLMRFGLTVHPGFKSPSLRSTCTLSGDSITGEGV
jgi:hypothetical protein